MNIQTYLDCTKSEEITLNLTNPTQPFLTTTSELVTNKLSSPLSTETTPIPETADLLEFDEMSQEALSQLISRLESVAIRLENQAATAGQQSKLKHKIITNNNMLFLIAFAFA